MKNGEIACVVGRVMGRRASRTGILRFMGPVLTSTNKKTGRPLFGAACFGKSSGEEGKIIYNEDGAAVGLGVCAGVPSLAVLVINRISTRRFFARPASVLFESTGLSLPRPIR